jgi:baculoviral IAP repeat-containing protein 6 (apollon)
MDVLKFLITGPAGTPYENGCFVFDVYFPLEYPHVPPEIDLVTNDRNVACFSPFIFENGNILLSVMGTWAEKADEMWNARSITDFHRRTLFQ